MYVRSNEGIDIDETVKRGGLVNFIHSGENLFQFQGLDLQTTQELLVSAVMSCHSTFEHDGNPEFRAYLRTLRDIFAVALMHLGTIPEEIENQYRVQ